MNGSPEAVKAVVIVAPDVVIAGVVLTSREVDGVSVVGVVAAGGAHATTIKKKSQRLIEEGYVWRSLPFPEVVCGDGPIGRGGKVRRCVMILVVIGLALLPGLTAWLFTAQKPTRTFIPDAALSLDDVPAVARAEMERHDQEELLATD
ncbi:MAG: hypothetical protein ACR2ME_08785 [Acidimicrobiia bacterium]